MIIQLNKELQLPGPPLYIGDESGLEYRVLVLEEFFGQTWSKVHCFTYAKMVARGRFRHGESTIMDFPATSGAYIRMLSPTDVDDDLIKIATKSPITAFGVAIQAGYSIPELEEVIATDPEIALEYAQEMAARHSEEATTVPVSEELEKALEYTTKMGIRFPQLEPSLAENSKTAYEYALHVIKGPWPEGESAIAAHGQYACLYAINILKDRFPAGEDAIERSLGNASAKYRDMILLGGIKNPAYDGVEWKVKDLFIYYCLSNEI